MNIHLAHLTFKLEICFKEDECKGAASFRRDPLLAQIVGVISSS